MSASFLPSSLVPALAAVVVLSGACGDAAPPAEDGTPVVVATTTMLGDLVGRVAGDAVDLDVLMEPGVDPHGFEPSARQAQRLREADLVVANGLGLEAGLADLLAGAEADGVVVVRVAPLLDPLPYTGASEHAEDGHAEDGHAEDAGGEGLDPHVWLDADRWAEAARVVADALADAGVPAPAGGWDARGEAVAADVEAVGDQVAQVLADVPERCRVLVTNHDAFGYLAARHGFEVVGVVLPGAGTGAEPSARDFAELAELLRSEGVPVVFAENIGSTRLAEALAREVGDHVEVVELVSDALPDDGGWDAMMRTNAERIVGALSDC